MNHTPLINSKRTMTLAAIALSCPFVQAGTAGYLSTSSAAGTSAVGPTAVYEGQQAAQDSINMRQVTLRQEKTREALRLLQDGRTAYKAGRYKDALDKYQAAWDAIPKAPATQRQQEFIIASIGDASIAVAIEYAKVARYDDAEQLLQDVLLRDPNNRRARHELSLLRDPVRNNPANTPENVRNVQEVQRLLEMGYGYYDLGKYDEAYAEANRILQIDPYNTAARRLQEQCSRRKSAYYEKARDAHRASMLAAVDAVWEEALPTELADMELSGGSSAPAISGGQLKNDENLGKIQIANVSLENATVEEALDFMRGEARKAGVSINFMYMPAKAAAPAAAPVSSGDEEDEEAVAAPAPVASAPTTPEIANLTMHDVSAKDLLQMICKLTQCSYRIEDKAIVVYQAGAEQGNIAMRKWKVAPSFFSAGGDDDSAGDDDEGDGFAAESRPKGKKLDAMASLKEKGALFTAKGSSARYDRATNTLIVYSTPDDLDMVEEAVNEFRRQMPRMVKVSTKFMEVAQTNEEELSFDWVINPFSVSNNGNMYLGGVNGQNSTPLRTVSDFVSSGGSAYASDYKGNGSWPITGSNSILNSATDPIGNGLMTGGLRTGTGAISANSMDSLLTAGSAAVSSSRTPAPGILALSGIYDSGSFQAIMRGLSQKKGVDVMSAPSLVLSPGDIEWTPDPDPLASYQNDDDSCAKIEVIRRFIYPTAYDAPEIDSGGRNNNNNNNNNNNWSTGGVPVASPANPSEWGVEEVGIVMRVRVEDDNAQMDDIIRFKHFEIRVVGFEGFVNYGSPITVGVTAGSRIEHITLTDNRIDMPIFSRRFINSNPKIYDGHTIAIGGLIEDNVQKVEDKVPVFGDLPFVGRFFRSEAESHVRKNLMIFVTAEYIDPTGKPIRHRDMGTGDSPTAGMSAPSLFPDEGLANP